MKTMTEVTTKKHNFYAGPAILPAIVLEQAAQAVTNFADMGLSILEISHRSPQFAAVLDEACATTKDLLHLGDEFEVLFLTGGASSQFFMAAMNLLDQDGLACYVDTGTWSTKAIKEAKHFGNIEVIASSKDRNFNYIPKNYEVPNNAAYLHLTSNNTIFGTQFHSWPETTVPYVCDMSSDIFSRAIDSKKYGMIYAGAQKNLGPAGTTLVIIRKDMLNKVARTIPTMLDYNTHIKKGSAFNTPPVYPIYVSLLTMRWIKANGGVAAMEKRNIKKAQLLYDEIDSNPFFNGVAAKEDRSLMNVTFTITNADLENDFLEMASAVGCVGLKGHRSVGGFRASIYNAMPYESVEVLVNVMKAFTQKYG